MNLSTQQLKSIYFGALEFAETEDGYLQAFQYTEPQIKYFEQVSEFWYDRCIASTAKTLEFTTSATAVSFEDKILWMGSEDSVELYINGIFSKLVYVKDLKTKGKISFDLPEGEKQVMIYLPVDATMLIRNFTIDGDFTPPVKKEKVLWMGDSITQGYGPLRSSMTYVSIANRTLKYDIINQGIGGYVYDKNVLTDMNGYRPDKIIIAMGTNQFETESLVEVEEYYTALKELYGDTPVLCISPIWRGDKPGLEAIFEHYCNGIKEIAGKYPNITVIDGFELVPHESAYFLDDLHPNVKGCELYADALVKAIAKAGF